MKITGFKLWKNVGYSEDSVNVPPVNASLPTPYFTSTAVSKCDRGDIFSSINTMQVPFDDAFVCSYLSVTYAMNDSSTITVYGWIDNVKQISDYPNENVRIDFHLDYWRTYISQVTLTNGMVKRRVANGTEPPQGYPFRYKTVGNVSPLIIPTDDTWWVYFTCTPQDETGTVTYTRICCFPVKCPPNGSWAENRYINDINDDMRECPSGADIVLGNWDEILGISPAIIQGIWMLPVPPESICSGNGNPTSPYYLDETGGWTCTRFSETASYWCYVFTKPDNPSMSFEEVSIDLPSSVITDDTHIYCITDFNGSIVATLPWGLTVTNARYRVVISTISCYLQIRFNGINSSAEGLVATIPGKGVATGSNSWSDYVYSGQRTADINARDLANRISRANGVSSAVSGAASGAIMGGLTGNPLAAVAMGAIGGLSSIIGTESAYRTSSYYAPKLQEVSDYSSAMQLDTCLLPGEGVDGMIFGCNISLVRMDLDSYSVTQRANDISLNGANVSEPTANCQHLLTAGGPLQIADVTVLGNIPNIAKSYIRARLNNGVRII